MSASVPEFMRFSAPDPVAHAQAIADARLNLQQALEKGDPLTLVNHVAELAGLLTTDRRETEALELLRAHAAHADALPHEEATGWYWNAYATALQYTGQRAEAEAWFAKALGLCEASHWTRLQAMVLHHWGRNLAEQQRFTEAEQRFTEALALRMQQNSPMQDSSRRALNALVQLREAWERACRR